MKTFMDEDFLLQSDVAKHLYHDVAEGLPIIDYHCHLSPKEIYEDITYENITQVWLLADHYKWRQMRANGTKERLITGDASDYEKFLAYAKTLEKAIGNPLYHWSHLELKRYFGYEGNLNTNTAKEVWNITEEKLKGGLSARTLIVMSGVETLCTTDDPADSLEWHKKLQEENFSVKVLPTFRPDRALAIAKPDYIRYMDLLSDASGVTISHYADLLEALDRQMETFAQMGCRLSDHGMQKVPCAFATPSDIERIFSDRMRGKDLTEEEVEQFQTALLMELAERYQKRDWAMQLHFGVQRDLNQGIYRALGADAGIDAIADAISPVALGKLFDALSEQNALPKTIVYSLNPNDNAAIDTVLECFFEEGVAGKMQHGSAWWFNDHIDGMKEHLHSLANLGLLGNFIGMLTDSRSFLSYARHEYFRRILCDFIGDMVDAGCYPMDDALLEPIVSGISYRNAKDYFRF